ncbi:inosine/xanthosine triphosphatase [candidate division KSB1 bacterium 4572_119]|nr:MAG: inosine/xanthosine triphosphatase [candidate division KSB1 bacterium 4572_119]
MKKIVVASKNPVKVRAVKTGFNKMLPDVEIKIITASVPSGVKDQPTTSKETLQGALNRVRNLKQSHRDADFWVGIEGGVEDIEDEMAAFAWIIIEDKNGLVGKSQSGTFFLPKKVAEMIRQGTEMGLVNDLLFNQKNSKQNNGAIGILTKNVINRTELYEHAIILALVPFKNSKLYLNINNETVN